MGSSLGVRLTWQAPASSGSSPITSYNIYRRGWGSETLLASTTGTSYNDASASIWITYYYRVTAVNAAGQGPYSTAVAGQRT
jgi:fibronectin type 3 domain-containing protein